MRASYPSLKQILFIGITLSFLVMSGVDRVSADDDEENDEEFGNEDLAKNLGIIGIYLLLLGNLNVFLFHLVKLETKWHARSRKPKDSHQSSSSREGFPDSNSARPRESQVNSDVSPHQNSGAPRYIFRTLYRKLYQYLRHIHYLGCLVGTILIVFHGILVSSWEFIAILGWCAGILFIIYTVSGIFLWHHWIPRDVQISGKVVNLRRTITKFHRYVPLFYLLFIFHVFHLLFDD